MLVSLDQARLQQRSMLHGEDVQVARESIPPHTSRQIHRERCDKSTIGGALHMRIVDWVLGRVNGKCLRIAINGDETRLRANRGQHGDNPIPGIHTKTWAALSEPILLLHGGAMQTSIRRIGSSQGVVIPKRLLRQVGLKDLAEMRVEGDALVLRSPKGAVRSGWAETSRKLAARGDDALVWPEFTNGEDQSLRW
jgi:antitoxin MazE